MPSVSPLAVSPFHPCVAPKKPFHPCVAYKNTLRVFVLPCVRRAGRDAAPGGAE